MRRLVAFVFLSVLTACGSSSPTDGTPPPPPPAPTVATVTVTPETASLAAGQTVQLTATPKDSAGNALSGRTVTWLATPNSVATVSATGLVTAVSAGTASITATTGGKSGIATISASGSPEVTTIGPDGGTVVADHGNVTLVFPAGALATATPISVTPLAPVTPPSGGYIGTVYELGPTGTQFARPVTLTMPYTPSAVPAGLGATSLTLHTQVNGVWQPIMDSYVDAVAHTVAARINHFSLWAPCSLPCYSNDGSTPSVSFYGNAEGPETVVVNAGGSVDVSVYVSEHHFVAGPATITVSGFPSGITGAGVTLQNEQGGHVHMTASANMPGGIYPLHFHISVPNGPIEDDNDNYYIQVIGQAYTFSASPLTVNVVQGGSGTSSLSFARASSFTSALALSAEHLPSGVTASFSPASVSGSSSTVTFTATPTAQVGDAQVLLRAHGGIVADATVTIDLFVNPANTSGFTLAGTPPFVNVAPGSSASTGIQATRTGGFAGAIVYSVSGLPNGLTATVTTTNVADSLKLLVTAAPGLAFGSYPVTITGTSGSKVDQVTIGVGVAAQGHLAVHLDYSSCATAGQPLWVAFQDGNFSFTHVVASVNNASGYDFTLTQATGAIAIVRATGIGFTTNVVRGTQAELAAYSGYGAVTPCAVITGKNITATAANTSKLVDVGIGGAQGTIDPAISGPTPISNVRPGAQDVTALVLDPAAPKMIFRRGQDIPAGGALAPFDFGGSEAFVPASAQVTGITPTITFALYSSGGAGCQFTPIYSGGGFGSRIYGIPSAMQQPGDLHEFGFFTSGGSSVSSYFHTMADQVLEVGPALTAQVSGSDGPFTQINASTTLPSAYQSLSLDYRDSNNNEMYELSTPGYAGGNFVTIATPALSSVAGYQAAWGPSGTVHYTVGASSLNLVSQSGPICSSGVVVKQAVQQGVM